MIRVLILLFFSVPAFAGNYFKMSGMAIDGDCQAANACDADHSAVEFLFGHRFNIDRFFIDTELGANTSVADLYAGIAGGYRFGRVNVSVGIGSQSAEYSITNQRPEIDDLDPLTPGNDFLGFVDDVNDFDDRFTTLFLQAEFSNFYVRYQYADDDFDYRSPTLVQNGVFNFVGFDNETAKIQLNILSAGYQIRF